MKITKLILLDLIFTSFHLSNCHDEVDFLKDSKGNESQGQEENENLDVESLSTKVNRGNLEGRTNGGTKSSGGNYFQLQLTFQGVSSFEFTESVNVAILNVMTTELAVSPCSLGNVKLTQTAWNSFTFSVMAFLSEDEVKSLKSLSLNATSIMATLKTKIYTIPVGLSISSFTLDSAPLLTETGSLVTIQTITQNSTQLFTTIPTLGIMDVALAPYDITHDSYGNQYITDYEYHVIRKISPIGVPSVLAGLVGSSGFMDGSAASAMFNYPSSAAVDAAGYVYVADTCNSIIRKVSPNGDVSTIAGTAGEQGSVDGDGTTSRFFKPYGISVDTSGNLFISDQVCNTIRKIVTSGNTVIVSTFAGKADTDGLMDGIGAAARFNHPLGLTTDKDGNIYVADFNNNAIRKITPIATVSTFLTFYIYPSDVAIESNGFIYVTFPDINSIVKISPGASDIVIWAGSESEFNGYSDGTGTEASFSFPCGLDVDSSGNVFVADYSNGLVRKIDPSQRVTTYAGKVFQ